MQRMADSLIMEWHDIERIRHAPDRGQSTDSFFIIQTSLGHWSMGLNIFDFG